MGESGGEDGKDENKGELVKKFTSNFKPRLNTFNSSAEIILILYNVNYDW